MAQVQTVQKMSVAEFEAFALHPDNRKRKLELIAGEVVETMVSNQRSTACSMRLAIKLGVYLERNPLGYLTDTQGGYAVGGHRLIPDIGFVPYTNSDKPRDGVFLDGLALAIEVLSPSDRNADIAKKVFIYTQHNIEVWIVDPEAMSLTIYATGRPVAVLRNADIIASDPLLPSLNVPLNEIFTWPKPD